MTHNHPVPEIKANTYVQMPGFTKDMHDTIEEAIGIFGEIRIPDEWQETVGNHVMNAAALCGDYRMSVGLPYHLKEDDFSWLDDIPD